MYDRKTWIILGVCGALLATNMYYSTQNQKVLAAERAKELAEKKAAAAAQVTTGESTAELTVETPPPPTNEETVTLANDKISFVLTNIGGGIKHAEFAEEFQVGSKDEKVWANRFGSGPIGALVGAGEAISNAAYAYKKELSVEGKKAVYIAKHPDGLILKKTFTLKNGDEPGADYLLDFDVQVENRGTGPVNLSQWSLFLGEASPLYQAEVAQQTGYFWHENGSMKFEHAGKFNGGWFSSDKSVLRSPDTEIEYAGVTNQFFATLMRPEKPIQSSVWAKPAKISLAENKPALTSVRAGLAFPAAILEIGDSRAYKFEIFIGPKANQLLKKMDNNWGKGWGDVMQYGWFSPISGLLNFLLNFYHNLLDGVAKKWAWGLAIILLTVTVRICIWPLHAKSTHTMKRMAMLQPEMAKLKEKYENDPNKLNTEMMGLYRKFGINPLGGCLPMFIQIPIFFGFYRMLQYAVELRGEPFLWVQDLSQPDTLMHIAGIPLNILPIVMAITSFLQIHFTPKTGDKMQQRIIMLMPFMFFFFCYNFASALALYWTTQNIFSIGQTWLMSKVPEPELKPVKDAGKSWVQRMAERQAEMQRMQKAGAKPGPMRDVTPDDPKKKRGPRTGG